MAAIMQKAASLNEEKENEQIGLIHRLTAENCVRTLDFTTFKMEWFKVNYVKESPGTIGNWWQRWTCGGCSTLATWRN